MSLSRKERLQHGNIGLGYICPVCCKILPSFVQHVRGIFNYDTHRGPREPLLPLGRALPERIRMHQPGVSPGFWPTGHRVQERARPLITTGVKRVLSFADFFCPLQLHDLPRKMLDTGLSILQEKQDTVEALAHRANRS